MPWVRFDDQFPIHRKVKGLSDSAFRLHAEAIFWCARNLTDGFVSTDDVLELGTGRRPLKSVPELVARGNWREMNGGWQIHDYLDYQPSKAQVLAERAARAERQARWRAKHAGKPPNPRRRVTNASRNASVDATPARPAPKEAGPGRPRAALPSHAECRRCDGHGWIEQPDGREARCPAPLVDAEGTA